MFSRFLFAVSLLAGTPAISHEFWIDPLEYEVAPGGQLRADLRNGQNFEGTALSWFDHRFTRFEIAQGDTLQPIEGRLGDTPALSITAPDDGLLVIVHETTPSTLTYPTWEKFLTFVEHKDFLKAAEDHIAAGWPQEKFTENYTRHAKSLVAVGSGMGSDRVFGLATEFVALTNPYDPKFDKNMHVRLNYNNAPRSNAQIEVFDRAPDGTVEITFAHTDKTGEAIIPVSSAHTYLFDAVVLRPAADAGTSEDAPVWESLWAALTFSVPE